MQLLDGLSKLVDGTTEIVSGLNPNVKTMDEVNTAIATTLLDAGFTPEHIINFIDVSKVQFEEWVAFEIEIRTRMAKKAQTAKTNKA